MDASSIKAMSTISTPMDINQVIHGESAIQKGSPPWPEDSPWPSDEKFDTELLKNGDARNVVDHYRYWKMSFIIKDLEAKKHSFHVAIENWKHDSNIGSIIRSANAFNAKKVHIIGSRQFNRKGAMVTDRYLHLMFHPTLSAFKSWSDTENLPIIGIDNIPGSENLKRYTLPKSCILLFGQEQSGLTKEAQEISSNLVYIEQFGSTRSFNAGAAGAIIMYEWIRQHS